MLNVKEYYTILLSVLLTSVKLHYHNKQAQTGPALEAGLHRLTLQASIGTYTVVISDPY